MRSVSRVWATLFFPIPPIVIRGTAAIVLGVATTVAVAWSLAYIVDASVTGQRGGFNGFKTEWGARALPTQPQNSQQSVYCGFVYRAHCWGTEIISVSTFWVQGSGPTFGSPDALLDRTSFAAEMKAQFEGDDVPSTIWRADGFPIPALSVEFRTRDRTDYTDSGLQEKDALYAVGGVLLTSDTSQRLRSGRALPLQPIWSGIIINSALYASLWFGLLSIGSIRAARRNRHRRRGICVRCGYKLVPDQTRCSECGEDRSPPS